MKFRREMELLWKMYQERDRIGTVWTLLRRARTAVGTCVVSW